MDKIYTCGKCGKYSNAESWNMQTIEDLERKGLNSDIVGLEELDLTQENYYYYICPYCLETCYIEDGHITEED